MQAVLAFVTHLIAVLFIAGHAFIGTLLPHPLVAVNKAPQSFPSASAATTTPKTFPIVKNKTSATKPAQKQSLGTPAAMPLSQQASQPASPASSIEVPALPVGQVSDTARAALVNILCITKNGGYLNPISGSGVFVAGTGVILTNAHVAQYFLLRDYLVPDNVDCRIRTGSPATEKYYAQLLYLPPAWIDANANQITADEGMGTGESDYAFLLVTSTISGSPLPSSFPSIAITTDDPFRDESTVLASYPAGFLNGITIEMNLYASSALTRIGDIFAFNSNGYADVVSLGGSVVAQAGSSGGAIVRQQDAALQGIIATESQSTSTTAERDLRGITIGHINRSLREAGRGGIISLLSGDLQTKADAFANDIAPAERQKLFDVLNKK